MATTDQTDRTPPPRRLDDAQRLLARFVESRDEASFAELVGRFGPMVFAVCRRVLGGRQDAEDAFQGTFLALARDGGQVLASGRPVAVWLHGIAYRVATHARRSAARRRKREQRQVAPMTPDDPISAADRRELRGMLDRELHALPDRLRQPLVLCYLAEQTHDQAAEQLGIHPRSLERRLRDALGVLHARLARHGVALPLAALGPLLAEHAARAVPAGLVAATTRAAAGLTIGKAATTTALWWGAATLVGVVLVGGIWFAGGRRGGGGSREAQPANPEAAPDPAAPLRRSVTAHGRVVDPAGRPMPGVTVLLLSRPVRRLSPSAIEPIPDPAATRAIHLGKFRELARGTTDADGAFTLTAEVVRPDPVTGAAWFQTLPFADTRADVRVVDTWGEFENLQWLPGVTGRP
jgi:RNA polymerase sigma factor (sigma-70 family)